MYVVTPQLTMEQAQFVVNVLNEIPLPGIPAKQNALAIQVSLNQCVPVELVEDDQEAQDVVEPTDAPLDEAPAEPPPVVE